MLLPDLGDALIPLTEDTPDNVGEWPANHAHGSIPCPRQHTMLQRASRQLQGQGGREREKTVRCLLSLCVAYGCAMK